MALIQCPECKREISDTAKACPNCGYELSNDESSVKSTELGPVKNTVAIGVAEILALVFIAAPITFLLFAMTIIFGFLGLMMMAWLLIDALKNIGAGGKREGSCPYCGHDIKVYEKEKVHKCEWCNKTSTRRDEKLFTID